MHGTHTHTHSRSIDRPNENKTTERSTNSFSILSLPIMYNRHNYLPNVWYACDIQVFARRCANAKHMSMSMSIRLNHWQSAWTKIETISHGHDLNINLKHRAATSIFSISFCLNAHTMWCSTFLNTHTHLAFRDMLLCLFLSLCISSFGSFVSILAFCYQFHRKCNVRRKKTNIHRLLLNWLLAIELPNIWSGVWLWLWMYLCVCVLPRDHNIVLAGGRSAHTVRRLRAVALRRDRLYKVGDHSPWAQLVHRAYIA